MNKIKTRCMKCPTIAAGHVLDASLDSMEETRFRKRNQKLALKLADKLHLDYTEVECILLIYYKLQKVSRDSKYGMDKGQFRDVLHCAFNMTDDYIMDRIFYTLDKGPSCIMSMETWVTSLSLFLRGTLEEKINYCFTAYDTLGEKVIGKETMFLLLRKSLLSSSGEEDAEETAKELIEVLTKKMDLDRDGKISYNDYRQSVLKQPMLLEAFGQCLPSRTDVHAFLTVFSQNPGKV